MRLTRKLLGHLYRPFDRSEQAVQALTIQRAEAIAWTVGDGKLTVTVPTLPAAALEVDLSSHTLTSLVAAINGASGYAATLAGGLAGSRSALMLLDGTGTAPGGAPAALTSYTSLLWVFMDAVARQLHLARAAIDGLLTQLLLHLAAGDWADYWLEHTIGGSRATGETDAALRERIISTILRVKSNNRALETLVSAATGISVTIEDIPWRVPSGAPPGYTVDGAVMTKFALQPLPDGRPAWSEAENLPLVAAFAVIFPAGTSCTDQSKVMDIIGANRAAGTHALAYVESAAAMQTNSAGEVTNDASWVCGPVTADYLPSPCT